MFTEHWLFTVYQPLQMVQLQIVNITFLLTFRDITQSDHVATFNLSEYMFHLNCET